ncbi:MAG: hypothetical protein ABIJ31_01595 [Pseudomonadota bacterium]
MPLETSLKKMEKHQENIECTFNVHLLKNSVCLKRKINGDIEWLDVDISTEEPSQKVLNYVHIKILNFIKPIFYQMPVRKINVSYSQDAIKKFGNLFNNYNNFLEQTNTISNQIQKMQIDTSDFEHILFFNVDENPLYMDFFEQVSKKFKHTVFTQQFNTGFNSEKRRWEDVDLPFSVPELIDYLIRNRIKTIYSINQYILEIYLRKTGIYLLSCFQMLGIEFVCIDHDSRNADLSKIFFSNNKFRRYSLAYIESKFWDKYYGVEKISYPTIPFLKINKKADFIELKDDYKIVVLSFSRLNQVVPQLGQILYFMEHLNEGQFFSQFQTMHHAMKYYMSRVLNCSEFEMLSNYEAYNWFGYNISQMMKFEIIEGLKTDRKIEIYGDEYWKFIFPEYYKGWLDKTGQIDELFSSQNCLFLILNWSHSMFTNNPHLYDAIRRKNPFLLYAPLAKTEEFKGFEHVEYDNIQQLNAIVENVQDIYKNPELIEAIRKQQQVLETSALFFQDSILGKQNSCHQLEFEKICNKTLDEVNRKVYGYMDQNELMLRKMYDFLFREPQKIDVSKSKFFNRGYVQRMIRLTPQDLNI